jgi:ribose/xylose/arabinose/galactoside ABC-type transport system permease subunit
MKLDYLTIDRSRPSLALSWLARLGPLLGLAAVCLFFSLVRPETFPTDRNAELIARHTSVVIVAALGMTLVIISGGIDLSVGSNVALSSIVAAVMLRAGYSPMVAVGGAILAGSAAGLLIGLLVTFGRLVPFIVTLGLWAALRGLAMELADSTRVNTPDTWLNRLIEPVQGNLEWMVLPPGVWFALLMALLTAGMLRYTRFGRHVFAVGSNEQTARLCGVNVHRTKIAVYVIAGALAGLAGVLQYATIRAGDPSTAPALELDVIAAVVIGGASLSGGVGTVLGTVSGALLMNVVANGCTKMDMPEARQKVVSGAIIILAAAIDRLRNRKSS